MRAIRGHRKENPTLIADARRVVSNEAMTAERLSVRRLAWITLMNARGNRCNQIRMCREQRERETGHGLCRSATEGGS